MKKWILPIILLTVLAMASAAQAQGEITIEQLTVDIWPEYDKPTALVIYNIILAQDTPLPADLTFQLPISVGEPNGYGYYTDTSQPPLQEGYQYQVEGDIAYVTFTVNSTHAHLEYYDPNLTKNGSERLFSYTWLGDYPVDSLMVLVQQPFGARDVNTLPAAASAVQGNQGLMTHPIDFGDVAAGVHKDVNISYTKESDSLSIDGLNIEPAVPINEDTQGRVTVLDILPWGLGVLGLLLLVGGGWWYWQTGNEKSKPRKRTQTHRTRQKSKSSSHSGEEAIYCHQCGKRANRGDRFCRSCGAKLRAS